MKRGAELALSVFLLVAAPAYAQTADQPGQPGNMPETGYHQRDVSVVGKITGIDFARGTLTLDNGMQFTLAPSLQFTSAPALGQEVEVIYEEQAGQKVAQSVDAGFEGHGSE